MTALNATDVLRLALATGISRDHANTLTVIAYYESGWDPHNLGDQTLARYGSRGLWQIFSGAWSLTTLGIKSYDDLYDPAVNAKCMHIVFEAQGFQAWSTWNHKAAGWNALLAKVAAIDLTVPAPPPVGGTVTAIDRAKAKMTVNAHGPDRCLQNVRECFGLPAAGDEPTAYAAWLKEGGHDGPNTHYKLAAPANVPGFLKHDGSPDGHIVVCVGDGTCYSTDFDGKRWVMDGKMHHVTIASLVAVGFKWLGWTETLEHVRVHPHV